jgi:hypothetical protein
MVNPWQRIPEIKVAGKTDPPRSAVISGQKRRAASTQAGKARSLPVAKLIALAGCVSLLAALILAALQDFRPEIVPFPARVEIFTVRYTMPMCFFQLGIFWVFYQIRKR